MISLVNQSEISVSIVDAGDAKLRAAESSQEERWGLHYLANRQDADPCPVRYRDSIAKLLIKKKEATQTTIVGGIRNRVSSCWERTKTSTVYNCCCRSVCCQESDRKEGRSRTYCGFQPQECCFCCALLTESVFSGIAQSWPWNFASCAAITIGNCITGGWQQAATRENAQADSIAANTLFTEADRELVIIEGLCREEIEELSQKMVRLFVTATVTHRDVTRLRSSSFSNVQQIDLRSLETEQLRSQATMIIDIAQKILAKRDSFIAQWQARSPRAISMMTPLLDAAYLVLMKSQEMAEGEKKRAQADSRTIKISLEDAEEDFPSWHALTEDKALVKTNTQYGYYLRLRKEQCKEIQHRERTSAHDREIEAARQAVKSAQSQLETRILAIEAEAARFKTETAVRIGQLQDQLALKEQEIAHLTASSQSHARNMQLFDSHAKALQTSFDDLADRMQQGMKRVETGVRERVNFAIDSNMEISKLKMDMMHLRTELTLLSMPSPMAPRTPYRTPGKPEGKRS